MSTRLRDVLQFEMGALRHEPTDKRIRAIAGGRTVIDSTRAVLVWEPKRIVPSYWSLPQEDDVAFAWTYREPLREAAEVTGRIAFFNERVDILVDGTPMERPATPWSRR
jgi:uncharacterized protein (DUF427 family)